MAARRGPSLVGRSVVDPDGVELGYVSSESETSLMIGEGPVGRLRLGRRFVGSIADRIVLRGTVAEVFTGLNVVDAHGDFVGVVRDTVEAEDVLDSLIVEDEEGEMITVLLEDIRAIDEWVELDVVAEALSQGG